MVSGYVGLLMDRYGDVLDGDAHEFLDFARDGAHRMSEQLLGLLEFSRVQSQGRSFAPVNLNEILDDVQIKLRLAIEESSAVIEVVNDMPMVIADRRQIARILQIFISNSITFRGETTPHIQIRGVATGNQLRIHTVDNGIGIAPEHQTEIFDIFRRLHTQASYPGIGMGLAIAKRIAERHGSDVEVTSTPGGGATFSFDLTLAGD